MKKLFPLVALLCMFVLQGCPQSTPEESDVLTPIKTEYTIGAAGGELSLTFKSNLNWEAKSDASWLTVTTPTKSVTTETVKVVAAENKSTESRKANVTIKAGTLSATIVVTQEGMTPSIVINGSTYPVGEEGGSVTVDVTSNVDYDVEISVNWITREGNTFNVEPNDSESERIGAITFSYGDISKTVSIKQSGKTPDPYLDIAPTSKNVAAAGETFTVNVSTNQGTATGTSSASWVTVNGTSVTVAANPTTDARTATVTFAAGSLSKTLTINQEAKPDTPVDDNVLENGGQSTFTVAAAGGDIEVIVRSNVEYKSTINCDWISSTKATTVREDKLTFHVAANEGAARTATIDFTYEGLMTVTVTVNQEAYVPPVEDPVLEINPSEVQVVAAGETLTVTVNANFEYTAECDDDWVTINTENGSCIITVAENPKPTTRTTMVQFSSEGLMEFLTIAQAATEIEEDPFDVGPNLSVNGTANCYVVTKAGNYTFDASVMGNGPEGYLWDESQGDNFSLWPKSAPKTIIANGVEKPGKALVIWNEGSVVNKSSVKYNADTKTISFTATGNKGAALIGLFESGTSQAYVEDSQAIWSWLIWCTDTPKEVRHFDFDDNEYVLLDRNIGATSANPADGKATYGYYFQFGRPNPLRAYVGIAAAFQNCEVEMKPALTHPAYVFNAGTHTLEWYNTGRGRINNVTADLWGNPRHLLASVGEEPKIDHHPASPQLSELKKTIYDPCPPGYIVPPERTWEQVGPYEDDLYTFRYTDEGVIVATENGDSFYPYAGFISALQSGEAGFANNLGWFGFKGYRDVLVPEGNPGNMCQDTRTVAGVYTSCTGNYSVWEFIDGLTINSHMFGGRFFFFSPDGTLGEDYYKLSGTVISWIRQKALPVRCMRMPENNN